MDHLQIPVHRRRQIVLRGHLQHLALGDGGSGFGQDRHDLQRAILGHQLEGPREQKIADQHRRLVAEHRIGAGKTSAQLALIDHVVMQQRRGVDELDAGGEMDMARFLRLVETLAVAAETRRGEGQEWPKTLAAGGH